MGRIILGLQNKILDQPANDNAGNAIPNSRSIQSAVRGTLANPDLANAANNFNDLRAISRLDMFVPKRTTLPVDTDQYFNFPRPTLIDVNIGASLSEDRLAVSIFGETNNKVGYDITISCSISVSGIRNLTRTFQITLAAGDVFFDTLQEWNEDFSETTEDGFIQVNLIAFAPNVYNDLGNIFLFELANDLGEGTPQPVESFLRQIASDSCAASFVAAEQAYTQIGEIKQGDIITVNPQTTGVRYYKLGTSTGAYNKKITVNSQLRCLDENGQVVRCEVGQQPQLIQQVTAISNC